MKRHFLALLLTGFVGSLVLVGNAEACHKKRCTCAPTACAVVEPAPCPAPAPVCEPTCAPRKHCGLFSHFKGIKLGGCFHKRACARLLARLLPLVAKLSPILLP